MRSVDDHPRRFYDDLQSISATLDDADAMLMTARIAHEVAGADGMYLLPPGGAAQLIVNTSDGPIVALANEQWRQAIAPNLFDRPGKVRHLSPGITLPDGRRIGEIMTFVDSTHAALSFVWCNPPANDDVELTSLASVACTCSLVLERNTQARTERERHRTLQTTAQHRGRNILALLRSIVRRSGETAESAEEFALHLEARISALARIQSALTLNGDAGPELEDLVRTELTANAVRDGQFTINGPSIRLASRAAETIALTLHELTTNALKFGALTTPTGHVAVSWSVKREPTPTLHWQWVESGVGIAQPAPHRRGFGQELIERVLPYELSARTEFGFAPGGIHCEILLPINERTIAHKDALLGEAHDE